MGYEHNTTVYDMLTVHWHLFLLLRPLLVIVPPSERVSSILALEMISSIVVLRAIASSCVGMKRLQIRMETRKLYELFSEFVRF